LARLYLQARFIWSDEFVQSQLLGALSSAQSEVCMVSALYQSKSESCEFRSTRAGLDEARTRQSVQLNLSFVSSASPSRAN
jgi:hypothetical protein